jgi:hypothetical protein
MSHKPRRSPNVTYETIDGRAVLVEVAGTELITLNPVGILVWNAPSGPHRAGCRSSTSPLTARGRWGPALRHLACRLFPTPVVVDYRRPGWAITSGDSIGGAGKIRSDDVERPRGSDATLGRFGPVAKLPAGKAAESGHLSVKRRPAAK